MNSAIIKALMSMSYRPLDGQKRIWAKPIGFGLVTFDFEDMKSKSYFYAANDGHCEPYASEKLLDEYIDPAGFAKQMRLEDLRVEDVICFLAEFECYKIKTNVYQNGPKGAFLTNDEETSLFLGEKL